MKKKIKTLVTVIAATVAIILPADICSLKAFAAEPATFHITYDRDSDPNGDGWYVSLWLPESDPSFDDEQAPKVMDFFYGQVKAGDLVVVNNSETSVPALDLGKTRLGNVVLSTGTEFVMIQAGSIDVFDALPGSSGSISASIANANLYDPASINFNNDVGNIVITSSEEDIVGTVGCSGTVGSLTYKLSNGNSDTLYNFKKDTLHIEYGKVQTAEENYSTEPSAAPQPTAAPAAPSQPSSGTSSNEYDQVPKTGDTNTAAWLLCAGALCMALSCVLRAKKSSRSF